MITYPNNKIKNYRLKSILLITIFLLSSISFGQDISDTVREAVDRAIETVKPALVRIHVVSVHHSDGREIKYESTGSGIIISKEGHIITNHHVTGRAVRLVCTLFNREEIEAELIGTDALSDISVIKLKSDENREFPIAQFGDSSKIKVGDYVLAMGSPLALSQSVTMGIISNTELVMPQLFWPFTQVTLDGEDVGSIVRWIGHDAAIFGGNSGGPLVNLEGEIIGINQMRMGLGGAIPGNLAKDIANKLIETGKIERSWLGFSVQPRLKSIAHQKGILISSILSESPAELAGFKPGDLLLRLANNDIDVRYAEELPLFNQMVADLPIGQLIDAIIIRDNKEMKLQITPIERESRILKTYELKPWGITIRNLSFMNVKEMQRDNADGVLVTSVRPGGPAGESKPAIRHRDVLTRVNDMPVRSVKELMDLTDKIMDGKAEPVPVIAEFDRGNEKYITVLKIGIREIEDPGLEVKRAWLPVSIQVLTRTIAEQLGIPELTGVRITQVYPNSTAEKAGLQIGDFIIALDGDKIPASRPEDIEILPTMIRQYRIGSTVELTVLRDKKELKIPVELIMAPKLEREMKRYRNEHFEFTVRDIAFSDISNENWQKNQAGVIVTEVQEGGWAAFSRLGIGDLIITVNGHKVTNVISMEKIMDQIITDKPQSVVIKVLRGIYNVFIEIEPIWEGSDL